jgi:hypothetical protein
MKVGDLVRVYDFSHEARRRLNKDRYAAELKGLRPDAHYIGLVVASSDSDPKHRRVMRCVDGEWEDYNVNRLEVIA